MAIHLLYEGYTFAGWTTSPLTEGEYSYTSAEPGNAGYCLVDLSEMTMPYEGLDLYPVLIPHQVRILLDTGAYDRNANEANLNGWSGTDYEEDTMTPAVLKEDQLRCFYDGPGETVDMTEGMDEITRNGYTFEGWYTAGGVLWNPDARAVPEYYDVDGDGKAVLEKHGSLPFSFWTITLKARWKVNKGRLEYASGEDTEESSSFVSEPFEFGASGKIALYQPAPPQDHVFVGWKDKHGNLYAPGSIFLYDSLDAVTSFGTNNSYNGIRLTAYYVKIPQGALIFDSQGGTLLDPIQKKPEDGSDSYQIEESEAADKIPSRTGYEFTGWFKEAGGSEKVSWPVTITGDENQTVYAGWKAVEYRITFDTAGGSAVSDIVGVYGERITTPADPVREGYTFAGWDQEVPSYMPDENMTITALWKKNPAKSEQEAPAAPSLTPDLTSIEVTPADAEQEYSIDGGKTWQKPDENGKAVFTGLTPDTEYSVIARRAETDTKKASQASKATEAYTSKVLLTAVSILGTPEYGETLKASITPEGAEDVAYQWYRDGKAVSGAEEVSYKLTAEDIGTKLSVTAVQTVKSGEDITVTGEISGTVRKADGPEAPEVKAEAGETAITVKSPAQSGSRYEYSLDGKTWQTETSFEGLVPASAYTVYAREAETETHEAGKAGSTQVTTLQTEAEVYEVYQDASGSCSEPAAPLADKAEGRYLVPEDPEHFSAAGYRFDTFTAEIEETEPVQSGSGIVLPPGTKKLYIYYERDAFELVFCSDTAGTAVKSTYTEYYDAPLSGHVLETVSKEGFTFAGWTDTAETDGTGYSYKAAVKGEKEYCLADLSGMTMPDRDLTLYPVLIRHRLVVHLDPGAFDKNADQTNMNGWTNPVTYTEDETAAILDADQYRCFTTNAGETIRMNEGMNTVTRPGYTLDGWYTDGGIRWNSGWGTDPEYCDRDDAGNAVLIKHETLPYSYYTMTLTARWAINWANVVYDPGEGSGDVEGTTCLPNGRVKITSDKPVPPEGYDFIGWRDKEGNLFTAGDSFGYYDLKKVTSLGENGANNTITLTAVYAKIPQGALIFDSQGGSVVDPVKKEPGGGADSYEVTEEDAADRVPTRTGYTFKGWVKEAGGSEAVSWPVTITGDDNVTVYADWEVNSYKLTLDFADGRDKQVMTLNYGDRIKAAEPEREHYTFEGWSPALPESMPAGDLTVTASWAPAVYTITFDTDGGSAVEPVSAIYGAAVTKPADPTKEGCTFAGWEPEIPDTMPDDEPTIKALWKQNQAKPDKPVIRSFTDTTITVETKEGQEYSIDGGKTWQTSDTFTGLKPAAAYEIVTRIPGSDTRMPSEISEPASQITDKSKQDAPAAPGAAADLTSIEVTPVTEGQEYSIDGGNTWKKPDQDGRVIFAGLDQDTEYSVTARWSETPVQYASPSSGPTVACTGKILLKDVTINGSAKYGKTLTASITPEYAEDVTYQWYRDGKEISGADGTSYQITGEDIGRKISVTALQKVKCSEDVAVSDEISGTAEKADGPEGPRVAGKAAETTIQVTAPAQSGTTFEYSLDGTTWQTSQEFTGLNPGTTYTVYARTAETETHKAGKAGSAKVRTLSTVAKVYEVRQKADGSYAEPSEALEEEAVLSYQIPADPEHFTAVGYRFESFSEEASRTTAAQAGMSISLPAGTKKLYIYYERDRFDLVFFRDAEGTVVKSTCSEYYEAPLSGHASESVSAEGFTFAGWTDTAGTDYSYKAAVKGEKEYCLADLSGMTMPDGDLFLYPVLIRHRLVVHLDPGAFDKNADETNRNGWTNPVTYTKDETAAILDADQYRCFTTNAGETIRMNEGMNTVTRPGYTLDGWYTKGGVRWNAGWGTSPEYCDKDASGNAVLNKHETLPYSYYTMTLTARWSINWTNVVYDPGEGSGDVEGTTCLPNGRVKITSDKPVPPEGYDFIGWRDKEGNLFTAGDTFGYYDLKKVTSLGENGANNTITLTAVYAKIPQGALIFDSQGGSVVDPVKKEPGGGADSYEVTEEDAADRVPTRTGYKFKGWVTEAGGSEAVSWPVTIRGDDNVTVYADWEVNSYKLTLDFADGRSEQVRTLNYGETIKVEEPERDHYTFDGWSPALPASMPAGDLTVTASWSPVVYTITFDTDGGSTIDPVRAVYGAAVTSPKDPEKKGYTFAGWDREIPSSMPGENMTVKALWKENQGRPDAPVIRSFTDTTITVAAEEGQEYSIDGGKTWQTSDTFTGLKPAAEYQIVTRIPGSGSKMPSEVSEPVSQKTDKSQQAAPKAPAVTSDLNSVEVTPVAAGQEYSIDGGKTWKKPDENGRVIFDGLAPDSPFSIVARRAETDVQYASPASEPTDTYTRKILLTNVTIRGELKYGETLTASIAPENAEDVSYRWFRNSEAIPGAEGVSLLLSEEDIDSIISVTAIQTVKGGNDITVSDVIRSAVEKADGPAAPEVKAAAGETIIEVTAPAQEGTRYEYSLDGRSWQQSTVFEGLMPAAIYIVYAREKETETHKAGEPGYTEAETQHTFAGVFEVYQEADGTWTEPSEALPEPAEGSYVIPADPDHFTAAEYSFDLYQASEDGRTAAAAGDIIILPAGTEKLFIYYERDAFELVFCKDVEGTAVSTRYTEYYDAPLSGHASEAVSAEGFTFAGWTDAPRTDGTDYSYKAAVKGDSEYCLLELSEMKMPDKDLTLYPVLIRDRLNVHLDLGAVDANATTVNMNGWTNPVKYPDPATPAVMDESQYRSFTVNAGEKIRMDEGMNSVTREGYELDGWFTSGGVKWNADWGAGAEYCDKDKSGNVILVPHETRPYSYYTITLTASWTPKEITVSYGDAAEAGKTALGQTVTLPKNANAPAGKRLTGWTDRKGNVHAPGEELLFTDWTLTENEVLIFEAQYEDIPEYGVTFDSDGGSYVESVTVEEGGSVERPADPTKTGARFEGWYLDGEKVEFPIRDIRKFITLKAKWSPRTYTITFDTKGGSTIAPLTLKYGAAVKASDPVKDHYTFGGWTPEVPETMPAYDLTVTASWTPETYTITFDTDGGSKVDDITDIYGAAVTSPGDPTKKGCTFAGWEPEVPETMPGSDLTIKALWKENQEKPAAPAVKSFTDTTITVDAVKGQEYSIDGGKTWQTSDIFTGLKPATEYQIVTRIPGSDTKMPSEVSDPASQKTDKAQQTAPASPRLVPDNTSIEVSPVTEGQEYSIDGGKTWKKPDEDGRVIFDGLTPDSPYDVVARRAETDTQYPSPASDPASTFTTKDLLEDVTISGTPVYGETLTASVTPEDSEDVTYQWYRDGEAVSGASDASYPLTAKDIGKIISVEAVQRVYGGDDVTVTDKTPGPVEKADGPEASKVSAEAEETAVTVTAPEQDGTKYEYSLDGETWQTEPSFEGLTPGTEYTVYARVAETDTHKAGKTGSTTVTTEVTTAEVYRVLQKADGSWEEPETPLSRRAEGSYMIPADPDHFTAAEYSFDLYQASEASRTAAAAGDTISLPAGTGKLFIYYERDAFELVFCKNVEGTAVSTTYTEYYDAPLSGHASEAVRAEGFTFAGWTDTPRTDGTDYSYKAAVKGESEYCLLELSEMKMPDKDLTLYPVLIRDRLNVRLDVGAVDKNATETNMNGWTNPVKYPDPATPAVMDESQYRSFNTDAGEKIDMTFMKTAVREGYELDGWFTESGVEWKEDWGTSAEYCDKDETGNTILTPHETRPYSYYRITLTASWTPKEITVSYGDAAEAGRTALGQTVTLPESANAPEGKRLTGWTDKKGNVHAPGEEFLFTDWTLTEDEVLIFEAQYEDIPEYGVTFDSDGGSYVESVTVEEGGSVERPADPTKTGSRFEGWYLDGEKVEFPIRDIRKFITVKAKWSLRTYTITFDTKGGSAIAPLTLEYGAEVKVSDPAKDHYTFDGWTPEVPETMPAYDLTVTASWTPDTYTITFDTDGGSKVDDITDIYGAAVTAPDDPKKDGYIFSGWDPEVPETMPGSDLTVKALWEKEQEEPAEPGRYLVKVRILSQDVEILVEGLTIKLAQKLASAEEQERVQNGEDFLLYLVIEKVEEETVPEDAALVKEALKAWKGDGAVAAEYLDISLYKQIGKVEPVRITDLEGENLTLTLTIPEAFSAPAGTERTFCIVRVHDGKAEIISEGTGTEITFETDKLSTYALGYVDVVTPSTAPEEPTITPAGPSTAPEEPTITPAGPSTAPEEPTITPAGPSTAPEEPTITPAGPSTAPEEPTITPAGPSTAPEEPTITPAGPSTAPEEPTITPAGPSTAPEEPTITPSGPSTTPEEPTITPAGPSTAPDDPTITPAGPSTAPEDPTITPAGPSTAPDDPTITPAGPSTAPDDPTITPAGPSTAPDDPTITPAGPSTAPTVTTTITPTRSAYSGGGSYGGGSSGGGSSSASHDTDTQSTASARTGDDSEGMLWLLLLGMSMIVMFYGDYRKKKQE